VPADRDLRWAHLYVQDQIALSESVSFALGAKLETNVFTGAEFLPSARLAWRPAEGRLVWAALSRAVRAPSRFDREYVVAGLTPPFLGGPEFRSEVSNVVELGVRVQPSPRLSLSATALPPRPAPQRSLERVPGAQVFANRIEGGTTGLETWATVQPHARWRLSGGVVVLDSRLRAQPGSSDTALVGSLANDPDYWATLRSSFDLAPRTPFDVFVRHVGARPAPRVASYTTVDARLGWELSPRWTVRWWRATCSIAGTRMGRRRGPRRTAPQRVRPTAVATVTTSPGRLLLGAPDRFRRAAWGVTLAALAALALALSLPAGAQPAGDDAETLERRVKAAFLFRFLEYVDWPASAAPAEPAAPIVVGMVGADDLGAELQSLVAGRTVRGRPVVVQRLRATDPVAGLHVAFVPAAHRGRLPELSRLAAQRGLLLVSEGEDALPAGSMIAFRLIDGRVRFEVALDAAERGGLRLSSRLLSVAYAVRGAP
jgi:hypothetical protein